MVISADPAADLAADLAAGASAVVAVLSATLAIHLLLPGRVVLGYACDTQTGKPLAYKLNGFPVLCAAAAAAAAFAAASIIRPEVLAENRNGVVIASNAVGVLGSACLYVRGRALPSHAVVKYERCPTSDRPGTKTPTDEEAAEFDRRSPLGHFFVGYEFNPRPPGRMFDIKMFGYQYGTVLLFLNVLSAAVMQRRETGRVSLAMACHAFCMSWFCFDYMCFERPHLYTYDLFAERMGFKLFWGCFAYYPNFYVIGAWCMVQCTEDVFPLTAAGCIALFFVGWAFTRGANMQKFWYKTAPDRKSCFFGLMKQETIDDDCRILCSGFWGVSRHVNYMGEIVQALAIALPGFLSSGSKIPLLYPLYYCALLIPRQMDDDALCARKYGEEVWRKYRRRVPYRIVPGVY